MHDLQYRAAPATGETFDRGSLVSLDGSGNLIAGCAGTAMPMWALNSVDDFDVNADVGNFSGGFIATIPATGGYEIFTTEFDTGGTYTYNTLLTAALTTDVGLVTPAAGANYNDLIIVGIVSQGETTGIYDQAILYFWPLFIPAIDIT